MRSEPIVSYIWLGLSWRYLQDAQADYPIHGPGFILSNILSVFEGLNKFGLQVTLRAAKELYELKEELSSSVPVESKLTSEQAKKLQDAMRDLQRTLDAEGSGNLAYIITEKRLDVRKLIGKPQALFAPKVFESLPEIARYDFAETGYCIAFERPTAAAFHILRGTEDVLRSFYCKIVKRNRVDPLLWGPMTDALRKRRNPPPDELLRNLDNIRISFRNPTQHPEKIYDIQEVQDLFALCIDVVNRMVRNENWNRTA